MFGTSLGGSLLSVERVLLVHGVGKHDRSCLLVNHLHARGVIGMNLAKDEHLRRARFLLVRGSRDYIGSPGQASAERLLCPS